MHLGRGTRTHDRMGGVDQHTHPTTCFCLRILLHGSSDSSLSPSLVITDVVLLSFYRGMHVRFVPSFLRTCSRHHVHHCARTWWVTYLVLSFSFEEIRQIASNVLVSKISCDDPPVRVDGPVLAWGEGKDRWGGRGGGGGRLWLARPCFSLVERVRTDRASTNPRASGIFRGSPRTFLRSNPWIPFEASFRAFLSSLSNATWNLPTRKDEIPSTRHNHVDVRTAHRNV